MHKEFTFKPAEWIPFKDKAVLERVRNIKKEDMERHYNPGFKIKIVPDVGVIWAADIFTRIKESDDKDRKLTMIMPNPCPETYETVAELTNRFGMHALINMGSVSSWQRMASRLVLYGPATPQVPSSILQLMPTTVYVSEGVAQEFECWEEVGY